MIKSQRRKWGNRIVTILLVSLLSLTLLAAVNSARTGTPNFFGYQFRTVQSGSMEAVFQTGSLIAIKPVDDAGALQEGDVITYQLDQHKTVTHRITKVLKQDDLTMYQTKGDNNEDPDLFLVPSEKVIGKYIGITIPYLGSIATWVKMNQTIMTFFIISGFLLIILSMNQMMKRKEESTKSEKGEGQLLFERRESD